MASKWVKVVEIVMITDTPHEAEILIRNAAKRSDLDTNNDLKLIVSSTLFKRGALKSLVYSPPQTQ
jgi:hypothetical protein